MARICSITGKKTIFGNNVSHSMRHTRRTFRPNIQKKRLLNPATGTIMTLKVSTNALRTLAKWDAAGKRYDLRLLTKV